ncbi:MAG: hypothetical protein KUG77_28760 [Nannocystaceae bacterium]|nr:hypothetical protein [Nannocystaceae bacterium]
MNKLGFALLLLSTLPACEPKESCVANCDESSTSDGGEEGGLPTGGAGLSCEELIAFAEQYIETHRACETLLDCETDVVCFPPASIPGTVSISLDGFASEAWSEIKDVLMDVCPCETPVSAGSLCNEAGECEAFNAEVGSGAFCPSVERDLETFLAANKGCTTNADCVAVEALCYVDACSLVALNSEANVLDWSSLDSKGFGCDAQGEFVGCRNVPDCDGVAECGDDGVCVIEPS